MKILLTGASGQLGLELAPRLRGFGALATVDRTPPEGNPGATILQDLGDLNKVEILLNRMQPDLIVNAAAHTAVDRAEAESVPAFRINAELPGCLARWAQRNGSLLMHYSTDYVFSGEAREPYREDAPTGPLNVYGESKLAGEWAIAASGCRHMVLRTSWVYSGHGNNFVLTMLRLARDRPSLSIIADQVGCPTWARNLAHASVAMLDKAVGSPDGGGPAGTWHYCDSSVVSWYDFALAIFRTALAAGLLSRMPETAAIPTSAYQQAAARPLYSVLDTSRIRAQFGIEPPGLKESLVACIAEIKEREEHA